MPPTAETLVGRGAELAALDASLAAARREFAAIEVVGEPGIGKTRLLAELEARADAQGCLVLAGSASELDADLPFGLFVDALDEYLYGLEPHRLAALDDGTRAELAHVFPALAGAAAEREERYRLHRAVRALLEELASPKPLVVVLDDLHWADSGSLELLGSLLRRPPAAPVLLALAVRPRQVPERIAAALERIERIELGAFSEAEARELVGDAADDVFADSGGNPFYLEQLARAPRRAAAGPAVAVAGVEVPRAVAAALAGELAQLSGDARVVLAGAAVAGDPFEPELAAAAADVSEELAMAALDDLLRGDLVRPTDVPRRFRFRHPLVRGAVYEGAPGGWRLLAHERSAHALAGARRERAGARPPRRALRPPRRPGRGGAAARGRCGRGGPRAGDGRAALRDRAAAARTARAGAGGSARGAGGRAHGRGPVAAGLRRDPREPGAQRRAARAGDRDRGGAREHARAPPRGPRPAAGGARAAPRRTLARGVDPDARDRPRRALPDAVRGDARVGGTRARRGARARSTAA